MGILPIYYHLSQCLRVHFSDLGETRRRILVRQDQYWAFGGSTDALDDFSAACEIRDMNDCEVGIGFRVEFDKAAVDVKDGYIIGVVMVCFYIVIGPEEFVEARRV